MQGAAIQYRYRFAGPHETLLLGLALGAKLRAGDVIALMGDLGAGKTTLTQAIARGMGIVAPVTSPTFALAQEYPGKVPLFHFDPYRLESAEAFADIGFDEYFERGGVIVVEWADKIVSLLPEQRLELTLVSDAGSEDENVRLLIAASCDARFHQVLAELNALPEVAGLIVRDHE